MDSSTMADETRADDESLAIRMMDHDEDALREVLKVHLQPTKDILSNTYRGILQECEVEEAVSSAALKLWQSAGEYNKAKGTLGAWFFTMAQSAAIDIIRREHRYHKRYRSLSPEYDPPTDDIFADEEGWSKEKRRQLKDLDDIIEHRLKGLQQVVAKADLAAGGLADAGRLAELHNTSKESVYVTRHKARQKIEKEMLELAQHRERYRGKK